MAKVLLTNTVLLFLIVDTDYWEHREFCAFPRRSKISKLIKEMTCLEFYFSSFSPWISDLELVTYSSGWFCRSFSLLLPFLAAYNFTTLFKGGKEVKTCWNNSVFFINLILFQIYSGFCNLLSYIPTFQLSLISVSKLFECTL